MVHDQSLPCLVSSPARALTPALCTPRAVCGPVSDSFDPPLTTIGANPSAAYPEGKDKAVFKVMQKVPESMRVHGDYTLRAAWLRGDV